MNRLLGEFKIGQRSHYLPAASLDFSVSRVSSLRLHISLRTKCLKHYVFVIHCIEMSISLYDHNQKYLYYETTYAQINIWNGVFSNFILRHWHHALCFLCCNYLSPFYESTFKLTFIPYCNGWPDVRTDRPKISLHLNIKHNTLIYNFEITLFILRFTK